MSDTHETFELAAGNDRSKHPQRAKYRRMTLDEAKRLRPGARVPFHANDDTARVLTINGQPKTWKRDPGHVEVPIKYGMYVYATLTGHGGYIEWLLVKVVDVDGVKS